MTLTSSLPGSKEVGSRKKHIYPTLDHNTHGHPGNSWVGSMPRGERGDEELRNITEHAACFLGMHYCTSVELLQNMFGM